MNDNDDDIVADLRERAAESRAAEGDYYADQFATSPEMFERAADQITLLRERAKLTDDERHAMQLAVMTLQSWFGMNDKATVALRGLLQRLGGQHG